ncbi:MULTISPECIES: precorrin-6y C5,15-methyltransferase (decarboxylating) subunit CbiE [unclassified Coleofasciculus]|uniref:precorrin-6y C5,15-methyltransferase (decarboxylating) subunit CbiE n=1 Tax=unclassified Coleofasciculus TaxID=2692782 RepID=UPI00187F1595|nr:MULTISPECIES: precorrin-6y C5,15-methyltransferase (decarboxylating) subunit CbiE [unclassified Coleofasciculus]MBE9126562.1 precorrin-6y C5,15-methyltransferase (decarboxylating) subunit CbiE [Coleofasciculus sp. LEGE 07081]MBE9149996.1 precorrin-6y C5,15-methyltransferase (decarboxylating) subunit CbiE [Coleofasciculus sp. LEGE 07092]
MNAIQVVGIGLDGAAGLTDTVRQVVEQATVLVGSDRHLSYFTNHPASRIVLGDFTQVIRDIRSQLAKEDANGGIVVLVSGDPLFFGLGRLLLEELPREQLTFYPHVSAVQLAFNRVKVPWQDAAIVSAHGRSMDELTVALQQATEKIAVLTDRRNTPNAIARLLLGMELSDFYDFWVCENLGGANERVRCFPVDAVLLETFAPLNVVVLRRQSDDTNPTVDVDTLPILGLPDRAFASFSDRPNLMTKREVRTLVLAELTLQPGQTVWDIGAGTGSVSIEIGRLCGTSQVYAIEKTAIGSALIEQNCRRLHVKNVISMNGTAPDILHHLPAPHRIFIGGSGGNLLSILDRCKAQLETNGIVVLALATLEHLNEAIGWFNTHGWEYRLLQVQLSRSIPVGQLTRLTPLNPVTIVRAIRHFGYAQ